MFRSLTRQAKLAKQIPIWNRTVSTNANIDVERLEKIKIPDSNSFVQNIFSGEAKVSSYFPYPKVLSDDQLETVEMVIDPISKIWSEKRFDPLVLEETETLDEEAWQFLRDMGSFGTQVPAEYGGMGCNNTQAARLAEISGQYDLGVGIILGAHQSIGYKGIVLFGTKEQKEKFLPVLASGEKIAAFALTEPSAGSDASGIKSRAVLSEDGKHWILNGSKTFISNGGLAHYFTVFAQTPVRLPNGDTKDKVTAFFVERSEGLTSGPPMKKMGIKVSNTAELWFDNVKIPVENVIGEVGGGFKVAMNILNNGRFGMGCALSGTMKKMIETATNHVNNRTQFGNTLASYSGIQEKIARMSILHYTTQSHAYMISGLMDSGMKDFYLEAAISKIFASEAVFHVVDETLQILGGMGYMRETGVEKIFRDIRIFRIFEGTNEILRLFVALTGMQFAGGHLREIQRAMKNPVGNMGMIFEEGTRRLRRSVGLDAPNIQDYVHPNLSSQAQLLSKDILLFSSAVEHMLIKYRQNVIHEQIQLNRLANAAIDIYTSLVILSRITRALQKNLPSAEIEERMCKVVCSEANTRIDRNLRSIRNGQVLKNDETMRLIAHDVLQNGGIVHNHPLQ